MSKNSRYNFSLSIECNHLLNEEMLQVQIKSQDILDRNQIDPYNEYEKVYNIGDLFDGDNFSAIYECKVIDNNQDSLFNILFPHAGLTVQKITVLLGVHVAEDKSVYLSLLGRSFHIDDNCFFEMCSIFEVNQTCNLQFTSSKSAVFTDVMTARHLDSLKSHILSVVDTGLEPRLNFELLADLFIGENELSYNGGINIVSFISHF